MSSTLQQHGKGLVITSPVLKTFGAELEKQQKIDKDLNMVERGNDDGKISPLVSFTERHPGLDDGAGGHKRRVRIDMPFHPPFILSVSLTLCLSIHLCLYVCMYVCFCVCIFKRDAKGT